MHANRLNISEELIVSFFLLYSEHLLVWTPLNYRIIVSLEQGNNKRGKNVKAALQNLQSPAIRFLDALFLLR